MVNGLYRKKTIHFSLLLSFQYSFEILGNTLLYNLYTFFKILNYEIMNLLYKNHRTINLLIKSYMTYFVEAVDIAKNINQLFNGLMFRIMLILIYITYYAMRYLTTETYYDILTWSFVIINSFSHILSLMLTVILCELVKHEVCSRSFYTIRKLAFVRLTK